MFIQTEDTPNPATLKFLPGRDVAGTGRPALDFERGANVSGAELDGARGLTQAQLDKACGDRATRLPHGLRIPACR